MINDLTTTVGFITAVLACLRIRRGGLFQLGLPCNSHTFMSSSQHKRGILWPFGDESYSFVVKGNEIAYRASLLILLCIMRSTLWFLENPGNSRCLFLPVLEEIMSHKHMLGSSLTNWSGPQLLECAWWCFCYINVSRNDSFIAWCFVAISPNISAPYLPTTRI